MRTMRLLAALGFMAAASPVAAQDEPGDPARGAAYAQRVCAECHSVISGEGYSPNPDAPPFEEVANTPGMTRRALTVWLQTSHPTMPNIMLEANDRDDLVAYIAELKAGQGVSK